MTPFIHEDTILAPRNAEGVSNTTIGGSFTSPDSNFKPEDTTMTYMFKTLDYTDSTEEFVAEATSRFSVESEDILVERKLIEEESTPEIREAEKDAEARAAKLLRRAEKRADETGYAPILHEAPLYAPDFTVLNDLAGHDAVEDVLEEQEARKNFGLTVLGKMYGDAFLTLTADSSGFFEFSLRHAELEELTAFSKLVLDFKVYDLKGQPDMKHVSQNLRSTGRLIDSRGFEALAWEDNHQCAFIRHCVNVAQALGYDLYFNVRAEKRLKELNAKLPSALKLVAPRSIAVDDAPEFRLEGGDILTAVYASDESATAQKVDAVLEVSTVDVKAAPIAAPVKAEKVAAEPAARTTDAKTAVAPAKAKGKRKNKNKRSASVKKVVHSESARQYLKEGEEVTMKVMHFAKNGAIIKDELGNEGFLGFAGNGAVKHRRLVVVPGDEVKVVVRKVSGNGFVHTNLVRVVDPVNHYLSCLQIGDVLPGVIKRKWTEHCYYVLLNGPTDGILATKSIANLSEVKSKLKADARLDVRIASVNPEKRNFHVEIVSFHADK